MRLLLSILLASASAWASSQDPLAGNWFGTLEIGPQRLRLVFKLKPDDKGGHTATMDSIDQGANDIPIPSVKFDKGKLTLEAPTLGLRYEGTIDPSGKKILGEFKQGPLTLPLSLERTDKIPTLNRPQMPKPPFPYKVEDVTFASEAEGVTLAGTLTTPEGDGPFPAVVLSSGSGPQDRDETLLGHKPFWVLADHLTRAGIAVLRFDDRGVGKSTGDFQAATSFDFAKDVRGGVEFLRKNPKVGKIGVAGHSEGGLIGPIVAADGGKLDFLVLLAGPGVPGAEIVKLQSDLIGAASGAPEEERKRSRALTEKLLAAVLATQDPEGAKKAVDRVLREYHAGLSEKERGAMPSLEDGIKMQQAIFASPWMTTFLKHDPRPVLAKVKVPVLAVNGERDLQVDPKQNLPEIEKALREGGNNDVTTKTFEGLNHLFQKSKTGAPMDYAVIEETMSVEMMRFIADWILSKAK